VCVLGIEEVNWGYRQAMFADSNGCA